MEGVKIVMVGAKIRERRLAMGKTIKQLAEECGVTSGYISQVERDLIEPSISSLRNIAHNLNLPMYYFFVETEANQMVVRKADRQKARDDTSFSYEFASPLRSDIFSPSMLMLEFKIAPNTKASKGYMSHFGDEIMLVLKGRLKILTDTAECILEPGDSYYLKSDTKHEMWNISDEELSGISVINSPYVNFF